MVYNEEGAAVSRLPLRRLSGLSRRGITVRLLPLRLRLVAGKSRYTLPVKGMSAS